MINTLGLTSKVKLHLTHSVMWSNIITLNIENLDLQRRQSTPPIDADGMNQLTYVLRGTNPKNHKTEYVIPISKRSVLTLEMISLIFENIQILEDDILDKMLVAVVDHDSSILYYYVHKGVKNYTD
ncbi:uncharacterized protein C5L36_0B00680 [Pichia kudriavzevii]|uniref:tRNA-splicing endonuclease subunit Sen15 domain-containing protein n=1 Tax=Pichia kudriavzevii TaxID=4909 RepID=A0A2U9R0H4_PICKU|nr:uncharacterized protein C5L36_0B00680 [Pichia kudriavzevii]AWU74801.1 hypothetical protein C5L36_0B00680 [Pichia kudriavzevii]